MADDIAKVTFLSVTGVVLWCPYCDDLQGRFCGDPRGQKFTCENCNKQFNVHKEADCDFL